MTVSVPTKERNRLASHPSRGHIQAIDMTSTTSAWLPALALCIGAAVPTGPVAAAGSTASAARHEQSTRPRVRGKTKTRLPSTAHRSSAASVSPRAMKSTKALRATVPQGTALVTAALLHYVDGDSSSGIDGRIRKALDQIPGGRAAAERMARSIRAAAPAERRKILGSNASLLAEPTSAGALGKAIGRARGKGFTHREDLLRYGIQLAPEEAEPPFLPDFAQAGIVVNEVQDSDGKDELVVVTKIVPPTLWFMDGSVAPAEGAFDGLAPGSHVSHHSSLDVPVKEFLVVTAVAEVDGNADTIRTDIEVALQLAMTLANELGDTNKLSSFTAALAYTEGMLGLSHGNAAPSLRTQHLTRENLQNAWGEPHDVVAGIETTHRTSHTLDTGSYDVLFNVPSDAPVGTLVTVTVDELHALAMKPGPAEHMTVTVRIRGREGTQEIPLGKSVGRHVQVSRAVLPGPVEIDIRATHHGIPPVRRKWTTEDGTKRLCGDYGNAEIRDYLIEGYRYAKTCPAETTLDLSPGPATTLRLEYDPTTNEVRREGKRVPRGPGGGAFFSTGDDTTIRAKAKVRISDNDPAGNQTKGKKIGLAP